MSPIWKRFPLRSPHLPAAQIRCMPGGPNSGEVKHHICKFPMLVDETHNDVHFLLVTSPILPNHPKLLLRKSFSFHGRIPYTPHFVSIASANVPNKSQFCTISTPSHVTWDVTHVSSLRRHGPRRRLCPDQLIAQRQ